MTAKKRVQKGDTTKFGIDFRLDSEQIQILNDYLNDKDNTNKVNIEFIKTWLHDQTMVEIDTIISDYEKDKERTAIIRATAKSTKGRIRHPHHRKENLVG